MANVAQFGRVLGGHATATAGTTQTIAGATVLTGATNHVTTGNASDGVCLPLGGSVGDFVTILNLSANALKVYPPKLADNATGAGGAINGGSADAAFTHAASKSGTYRCTGSNNWIATISA